MKTTWNRLMTVTCGAALTLALGACGDDKGDPEVVSVNDLKAPGGLTILDHGNGKVSLQWSGINFEDDFEGYNVYGAKGTPADLGVTPGQPLELLTEGGEVNANLKATVLTKFDYAAANTHALPGAPEAVPVEKKDDDDKEKKIQFLPIHSRAENEPILPTCQPLDATCTELKTTADKRDAKLVNSGGVVNFDLPNDLTVGESYCFFVFSVQDEGEEISQSSTNVECITPKYQLEGTAQTTSGSPGDHRRVDLRALRETCETECPATIPATTATAVIKDTDAESISFESLNAGPEIFISTGKNVTVRMYGIYDNGFDDADFLRDPPKFTYCEGCADHGGGYSLEAQSVVLKPGGIYVIAVGDADRADTTNYYYHWLSIPADAVLTKGAAFNYTMRIAKNQN